MKYKEGSKERPSESVSYNPRTERKRIKTEAELVEAFQDRLYMWATLALIGLTAVNSCNDHFNKKATVEKRRMIDNKRTTSPIQQQKPQQIELD